MEEGIQELIRSSSTVVCIDDQNGGEGLLSLNIARRGFVEVVWKNMQVFGL